MLNQKLLDRLKEVSIEEQRILDGDKSIQKNIYSSTKDFVIDSRKMLDRGRLIDIRTHTRFVHFPRHKHNYIEIIYMCSGTTLHLINNKTSIQLEAGDLLFLNQNVSQEIMPADYEDVAINFIVLPEFFERIFPVLEEENMLRDFVIGCLRHEKSIVDYLHFETRNIPPIQNILENLLWIFTQKRPTQRDVIPLTMSLLFLELLNCTDIMNQREPAQFEQNLVFSSLKYIEENYKTAALTELAYQLNQPDYYLSKIIKKYTSSTYKELLQTKRLTQATYLLLNTTFPVEYIIEMIGYDNTSYFYRKFKEKYGTTPKDYRETNFKHHSLPIDGDV